MNLITTRDNDVAQWSFMSSDAPVCVTPELLKEMRLAQSRFRDSELRYLVIGSDIPKIFSLGGDLNHMLELIDTKKWEQLRKYAVECTKMVYDNWRYWSPTQTTISLAEGKCVGGGMEAILSSNIVVAETDATFSMPEWVFNMFPGMGAYQIITARATHRIAREVMASKRTFCASDMYVRGLVDHVVGNGQGREFVKKLINTMEQQATCHEAITRMKKQPWSWYDFNHGVVLWMRAAQKLSKRDILHMHKMKEAQRSRYS